MALIGMIAKYIDDERKRKLMESAYSPPPLQIGQAPDISGRATFTLPQVQFNQAGGPQYVAPEGQRQMGFWDMFLNSYQTNPNAPMLRRLLQSGGVRWL